MASMEAAGSRIDGAQDAKEEILVQLWIDHYNRGRPHMGLAPAYRSRCRRRHCKVNIATVYRHVMLFPADRFSVACTTNTGWKRCRA